MNRFSILDVIGHTPLVYLKRMNARGLASVFAKIEMLNPGGSIKDRVALAIIQKAEEKGLIIPEETTLIAPSSGNLGIGLAMISAVKGYRLIVVMSEGMSLERRKYIQAYGAKVVLTPAELKSEGALIKAKELAQQTPKALLLDQYENEMNPAVHEQTTAEEIWKDCHGKVDLVVLGVGTGGTLTGLARGLKKKNPKIEVIGVEPAEAPFFSQQKEGVHGIQGLGSSFFPKIYAPTLVDEFFQVDTETAIKTSKELRQKEGIFAGISSGAAAYAALTLSQREKYRGKTIVTILPDRGERYWSSDSFL